MTEFQVWIVFGTLSAGIVLFASQRIRYDVVSVLMLLALGLTGILSLDELFLGFASPAVITVASALVIARALYISGAIERLSDALLRFKSRPIVPFILLLAIVSLSSGFINDIAALAIALPLAVSLSRGLKLEPSKILIPLAYASIMGGALTLIGTASNIVMSSIARQELGRNLGIFEFAFVGLPLISVFLILVFLFGKRVLPVRASAYAHDKFELPRYIAEVQVSEKSRFVGKTAGELEKEYDGEIEVVRVVRGSLERELPHSNTKLRSGDFLVVRIEPEGLRRLTEDTGLQIKKNGEAEEDKIKGLEVVEAVVLPTSVLIERTARQIHLRDWLNVTLLGVARHRATLTRRVGDVRIKVGDVLLLEGAQADLATVFQELKCVPLGGRRVTLGPRAPQVLTLTIAGISIALSALGILPTEVALATGAVSMILLKSISIEEAYRSIQWPILI
ncbi:MAG: SLC13 family permease, partial [Thaumarchaeota archaeon]|nr:SLC13 family permease [Nitrososphaerota archaeon]